MAGPKRGDADDRSREKDAMKNVKPDFRKRERPVCPSA